MAWPEKRENGLWRGGYRDANNKRRYTPAIYTSRTAAKDAAYDIEREARRNHAPAADPKLTWGTWRETWMRRRQSKVSMNVYVSNCSQVRKHLAPKWDRVRLVKITKRTVRDWVEDDLVATGLGADNIHKIYYLFSASLTMAAEQGLITQNPCRGIELPDLSEGHERFLSPSEVDAAAGWMQYPYDTATLLLPETGLRVGELAGLHWQHIDFDRRIADILVSWEADGKVMTPTKGRKRRTIPLSDRAMGILKGLDQPSVRSCGWAHKGTARCRSALVLPSRNGHPLDGDKYRWRHWNPALELADIAPATVHDLRHTFASWMIQRAVPLSDIAEALGHTDAYVTRRYAHLDGSHLERIRKALDATRAEADRGDSGD